MAAGVSVDVARDPLGAPVATLWSDGTTTTARYQLWGNPGAELPLVSIDDAGNASVNLALEGQLLRVATGASLAPVATDAMGSVVLDSSGFLGVPEAFGTGAESQSVAQAYAGLEAIPEMPYQLARARAYDPTTGRFASQDPIGLAGGDHRFAYAASQPTGFSDPSGLAYGRPVATSGSVPMEDPTARPAAAALAEYAAYAAWNAAAQARFMASHPGWNWKCISCVEVDPSLGATGGRWEASDDRIIQADDGTYRSTIQLDWAADAPPADETAAGAGGEDLIARSRAANDASGAAVASAQVQFDAAQRILNDLAPFTAGMATGQLNADLGAGAGDGRLGLIGDHALGPLVSQGASYASRRLDPRNSHVARRLVQAYNDPVGAFKAGARDTFNSIPVVSLGNQLGSLPDGVYGLGQWWDNTTAAYGDLYTVATGTKAEATAASMSIPGHVNGGIEGAERTKPLAEAMITVATMGMGVPGKSLGGPLRFSQTTASAAFSMEGAFAGETIGSLASKIRSGAVPVAEVPIQYVNLGGNTLIVNTRSSLALRRAGVPQSSWSLIDATAAEAASIEARLLKNGLTSAGADTLRITGAGPEASSLR